jgi:hypothetical protein
MFTEKTPLIAKYIVCEKCKFKCSKNSDYKRHILTRKHINTYTDLPKNAIKTPHEYTCNNCNKIYKFRQSLYTHKKSCDLTKENENIILDKVSDSVEIKTLTNLVLELVKSNNDLQNKMIEVCKNTNNNTTTQNINNNSHNKTFNLQVFLNEECKDAMNLSEFINSLQVQLSDLENMSSLGYTEGITKIILKEMNIIDQNKRPVHCTDIKRDILYVKDEDKWEKEQPEYPKLKQAIRKVEQKNFGLMGEWQAEHPDYKDSTTHENTEFLKLVSQTMNGTPENMHKVIKKIAKEVVIDK